MTKQLEILHDRAIVLARAYRPVREAQESLNEMLAELDLPTDYEEMPEALASRLFQSVEMDQHLENLSMQDVRPRAADLESLTELRSALLL